MDPVHSTPSLAFQVTDDNGASHDIGENSEDEGRDTPSPLPGGRGNANRPLNSCLKKLDAHSSLKRQVSFSDLLQIGETYEKYNDYFSEYVAIPSLYPSSLISASPLISLSLARM